MPLWVYNFTSRHTCAGNSKMRERNWPIRGLKPLTILRTHMVLNILSLYKSFLFLILSYRKWSFQKNSSFPCRLYRQSSNSLSPQSWIRLERMINWMIKNLKIHENYSLDPRNSYYRWDCAQSFCCWKQPADEADGINTMWN